MSKLQLTSPNGGTLNTAGTYCESNIEIIPKLQDKTVTESGTVTADEGYVGLGSVTVNVESAEPKLQEKTVTANGEITADDGYDGLSKVTVEVKKDGNTPNCNLVSVIAKAGASGKTIIYNIPAIPQPIVSITTTQ